ncbi:MAG: CARDB domain-containing protein [Candidatus Woesearchaeota archaeon]
MGIEDILHKVKRPVAIGGAAAYLFLNTLVPVSCAKPAKTEPVENPPAIESPAPTQTYTPEPTQEPALADLTFCIPVGESEPIAIVQVDDSDNEWYISVCIKNSGGTTAKNVVVNLGSMGQKVHTWQISELEAWNSKSLTVPLEEITAKINVNPNSTPFGVAIDPGNNIEESDETNNNYSSKFRIPALNPAPTPTPTPTPPLQVIIQGEVPAPILIDLNAIQYEPIVSYEGNLGNTDVSIKNIFESAYYGITGKTLEKVLTKDNNLEERLKIFPMSEQELVKNFGEDAKIGITKSNVLTAADGSYVTGMNAYFNKEYDVYKGIATLAHEALGHAYAYMYEPNDLAWKDRLVKETVADIREVIFIRYLEEKHGLTAYKVSNNQTNKSLAQNLVKSFLGEQSTNVHLQGYKGIWNEVLNNPEWHDEAVKGRLSVETLWDISVYVLKQPSWTPPDKLTASQQELVKGILISRFEPSTGYNGKLNEKSFGFP